MTHLAVPEKMSFESPDISKSNKMSTAVLYLYMGLDTSITNAVIKGVPCDCFKWTVNCFVLLHQLQTKLRACSVQYKFVSCLHVVFFCLHDSISGPSNPVHVALITSHGCYSVSSHVQTFSSQMVRYHSNWIGLLISTRSRLDGRVDFFTHTTEDWLKVEPLYPFAKRWCSGSSKCIGPLENCDIQRRCEPCILKVQCTSSILEGPCVWTHPLGWLVNFKYLGNLIRTGGGLGRAILSRNAKARVTFTNLLQ